VWLQLGAPRIQGQDEMTKIARYPGPIVTRGDLAEVHINVRRLLQMCMYYTPYSLAPQFRLSALSFSLFRLFTRHRGEII
jgi:hypothetical protein